MAFKVKAGKAVSHVAILKEGFEALLEIIEAEQGVACKAFVDHSYNAIWGLESLDDTFRQRLMRIVRAKRAMEGAHPEQIIPPEAESARLKRMAREAMV